MLSYWMNYFIIKLVFINYNKVNYYYLSFTVDSLYEFIILIIRQIYLFYMSRIYLSASINLINL